MPVRPSRVRRLRTRKAVGNAALTGAAIVLAVGYVAVQKTVTLVVEGEPEVVRTMSANVGELLDTEGVVIGSGDVVTPPEATPLSDGMTVQVDHFAEGFVAPAPRGVGVWVMDGVPGPLGSNAARSTEVMFSAGYPAGRSEVVGARVVVMGKDLDVLTNAPSVGKLLSAMGIEPDRWDRVQPSPKTPLQRNMQVRFTAIDYRINEVEVPIPFTTYTSRSDDVAPGEVQMVRAGVNGVMMERYEVKLVNGEPYTRTLLSREVLREAIAAKRIIGRERAVPTTEDPETQVGEASWYSFAPGDGLTGAHPWLPFGTVVRVTNIANGNSVTVVINDRGPFGGRIIDLSEEAFARIAHLGEGVCQVRLVW
jgi:resuscitation-promoting factor RpfB